MKSTALGAENIIFISDAHEKFYYEKLQEVRYQDVYHNKTPYTGTSCDLWRPRLSCPEETLRRSHRTPPQKCPLCKMDNIV